MKKYLISILMLGVFLFILCGCGGTPLGKAYDALSTLAEDTAESGAAADPSYAGQDFNVQYDEESDTLLLKINREAAMDPVFEKLYEAVGGKEIGTLIFQVDPVGMTGHEKAVEKKIGALPCSSLERLGVDYSIVDYDPHDWIDLAEKTEKLYIDTDMTPFGDYDDAEKKKLSKIKDVQIVADEIDILGKIDTLRGVETISIVEPYVFEAPSAEDPLGKVTKDNPYLDGADGETAAASTSAETEASTDESAPALVPFEYTAAYGSGDVKGLARLENLKTLLIYPETGYELTVSGQTFIKTLQVYTPDLRVNAPDAAGTEDPVAVTDIKTPDVTEETANSILADYLKDTVADIYEECDRYKKKTGDPVLNGNALIFRQEPLTGNWSEKKKFTDDGNILITEPSKKGINVPSAVNDFKTFVFVYPTYSRTGVYTNGTKAYSQTLHVQVYDMEEKVAYDSETVGTAAAPQSFSYFAGSVPDKYSGTVGMDKVYNYMKKLKTK